MTSDKLTINNIDFKWGTTFEESQQLLPFQAIDRGQSGWQDLAFECDEIAGLKTTTCSIRAPKANKPVMQVSFELKPLRPEFPLFRHSPYVEQLKKIFGEPYGVSTSEIHSGLKYNEKHASGSVIYNCKWSFEGIVISLSVYGGIRTSPQGESAAGLYFDWMDEKSAAAPFMHDFLQKESDFTRDLMELTVVSASLNMKPYHRSHYELDDPHKALKDEYLRACQMALYTNNLFRIGEVLKNEMEENHVGIFYAKEKDTYCVYNKWDFSPITKDSKLEFLDILPARGGGSKEIRINSLTIKDERSSNALDQLKSDLEDLSGMEFKTIKGYDD